MKKYSWIMALLLALTLAFIGCPTDGGGGGGGGGGEEPEPPIEGGGIQWGEEPGMKPTLIGGATGPVWSDDNGGTLTIKANSNTGFTWTWAELSTAAGKDIKRDGGNLYVFYVIEVKTPAAALTIKNPGAMSDNPGSPGSWGQGKGAEYVLGDNVLSNYQAGGDKIVSSLYSPDTGRGWFEINPLVYASSTGVGFQHNYWCDMGGNGTIAEDSEYTLKIISIDYAEPDLSVKVNLAAIPGVTVPIKNEAPVAAITETAQYTGTVAWAPAIAEGGTFAADTAYTATITLTAKEGFTFEGVAANFFTVAGATATNPANSGVVTAVFPATTAEGAADPVTNRTIAGVTAPAGGATPVTAITADEQFTGTVAWKDADGTAVGATFDYEKTYTATITLTPKDGFTFTALAEGDAYTVTGATSVTFALVAGDPPNSGTITAVFPVTGPAPIIPAFTIDAGAGTATHDNFVIVKGAAAHGGFNGTDNEDNSFTITTGGIRYEFPETATGFDLADYDFVEFEYEASGVNSIVLKQYASSADYTAFSGSIANGTGAVKFELRYATGGGFAIQKWSAGTSAMDIEITKITFSKGTRYNVTYDPDAEGVTAPTSPAFFVDGTKVGNTLPSLTREGYLLTGWALEGTVLTPATDVDSSFNNATLKAQWKAFTAYADQVVVFTTSNLVAMGNSENTIEVGEDEEKETVPASQLADVAVINDGAGYTVETHYNSYGNSWAYFTYTFTGGASLADFNVVKFTYQAISGDTNNKSLRMIAKEDIHSGGNYLSFDTGTASPIGSQSVTGNDPIEVVLTIDQSAAAALSTTVEFAIGIHGNDYKIQITGVTFAQVVD